MKPNKPKILPLLCVVAVGAVLCTGIYFGWTKPQNAKIQAEADAQMAQTTDEPEQTVATAAAEAAEPPPIETAPPVTATEAIKVSLPPAEETTVVTTVATTRKPVTTTEKPKPKTTMTVVTEISLTPSSENISNDSGNFPTNIPKAANENPKSGDVKYIDGRKYVYSAVLKIWCYGDGGSTIIMNVESNGETIPGN